MATCRDCKHCGIHAGYWICKAGNKITKVAIVDRNNQNLKEKAEDCSYFEDKLLELIESIKYC